MRGAAVAVAVVLLLPAAGLAHVEVRPALLESGRSVELSVELPVLRPGGPPTSLAVSGNGVRQLESRLDGRSGRETRWVVRIRVGAAPGPTELVLRARFDDGRKVQVRRVVTVVPARADEDGLSLAAAAFAAIGLAALAAAAVFLRRPRRAA